jgi:predicted aldo/keto reductase-like oxidoreductase
MSVARYNFVNDYHFCGCGEVEDDNGEYVEYADYQKLLDENAKLRAAIDRVRALHRSGLKGAVCDECEYYYPCPTLRALDGEGA